MTLENNTQPDGGTYGQYDGPYSKVERALRFGHSVFLDLSDLDYDGHAANVINDIQQLYTFGVTSRDPVTD